MYLIEVDNLTIVCTQYSQVPLTIFDQSCSKADTYKYEQAYILDHHIDNVELDQIATILISKVYELCDDLYGGPPLQVMTIRTEPNELKGANEIPHIAPNDDNQPYSR